MLKNLHSVNDDLGEKGIVIIIRIIRIIHTGTTLVNNSFNFSRNPKMKINIFWIPAKIEQKESLMSLVSARIILIIIIIPFSPKSSDIDNNENNNNHNNSDNNIVV